MKRFLSVFLLAFLAIVSADAPWNTSACKLCATSGNCDTAYNNTTGKFCGLVLAKEYCCCSTSQVCPAPGETTCNCLPATTTGADYYGNFTKTKQVLVLIFLGFLLFGCVLLCERLGLKAPTRRDGYTSIESAHYPG
ncbi:hypothetical protein THRCLA_21008 [Thraustotheca clavata]|uniref:Secreted protein n=1 Tax=Thraustotheca clavata TaxID=74557 RepID=A0A1W0A117_9STRA|nr:hypothetical protein THRCLA_21008 [Thraustotheca clavata]